MFIIFLHFLLYDEKKTIQFTQKVLSIDTVYWEV